jgi:hypothetical protein
VPPKKAACRCTFMLRCSSQLSYRGLLRCVAAIQHRVVDASIREHKPSVADARAHSVACSCAVDKQTRPRLSMSAFQASS